MSFTEVFAAVTCKAPRAPGAPGSCQPTADPWPRLHRRVLQGGGSEEPCFPPATLPAQTLLNLQPCLPFAFPKTKFLAQFNPYSSISCLTDHPEQFWPLGSREDNYLLIENILLSANTFFFLYVSENASDYRVLFKRYSLYNYAKETTNILHYWVLLKLGDTNTFTIHYGFTW